MRLAELSRETGVSVATLKYYLREGLVHPGRALSRTSADYDEGHVERVRLVRALSEVGGLPLARIRRVVEVITDPGTDRLHLLRTAHETLTDDDVSGGGASVDGASGGGATGGEASGGDEEEVVGGGHDAATERALDWLAHRGWEVDPGNPFVERLARAWEACDHAGLGLDEERMDRYADHVEGIAAIDVLSVPEDPVRAVRHVVLGTVLADPVLAALRRLAQQHVSRQDDGALGDVAEGALETALETAVETTNGPPDEDATERVSS